MVSKTLMRKSFLSWGMARLIGCTLIGCTLVGCTMNDANGMNETTMGNKATSAQLFGHRITDKGIWVSVRSTGCTRAASFRLDWQKHKMGYDVDVLRVKPDWCRKAPSIIQLLIPFDRAVDASVVSVSNPIHNPSTLNNPK